MTESKVDRTEAAERFKVRLIKLCKSSGFVLTQYCGYNFIVCDYDELWAAEINEATYQGSEEQSYEAD